MTDLALVAACETRLVNAWPSFEVACADGWLLRFAEGYSKRANAATPLVPGCRLDPDLVRHVAATYEARGIAPCFRLTGLEDPGCETVLASCGFADFDPSLGLVASLDGTALSPGPGIRLEAEPGRDWVEAAASAYGGEKADPGRLGRIVAAIRQPRAFATVLHEGEPAAWGLAVAERGFVGLYDIVVAPAGRGTGLGRRLVGALLRWGAGQGAGTAYLQMRESNVAARALYRSFGFEPLYRYTHRVLPARPAA